MLNSTLRKGVEVSKLYLFCVHFVYFRFIFGFNLFSRLRSTFSAINYLLRFVSFHFSYLFFYDDGRTVDRYY